MASRLAGMESPLKGWRRGNVRRGFVVPRSRISCRKIFAWSNRWPRSVSHSGNHTKLFGQRAVSNPVPQPERMEDKMPKATPRQRRTEGRVMHEFKHGELKSGPGGRAGKVKN